MEAKKKLLWAVASFLLAVLTIRTVMHFGTETSLESFIDSIEGADKFWLNLSIIASAMYVWCEGMALRTILNGSGYKVKQLNSLVYSTADVFFSAITPSATGGQPASAFFMLRDGISAGMTTATLVLNLMMYTVSIVVLGVIAIIMKPVAFLEFSAISKALIILGFFVLTVLSIIFFLILKQGKGFFRSMEKLIYSLNKKGLIKNVKPKLAKLKKHGADYGKCTELIRDNPSMVVKVFIWTFVQRASQIAVPMLVYLSYGGEKNKSALMFSKQCLMNIGYNFIPIPGAMGVSDYLMLDGFVRIMQRKLAFRIELLSRGIMFYVCVSLSGIITLIGYLVGMRKEKKNEG